MLLAASVGQPPAVTARRQQFGPAVCKMWRPPPSPPSLPSPPPTSNSSTAPSSSITPRSGCSSLARLQWLLLGPAAHARAAGGPATALPSWLDRGGLAAACCPTCAGGCRTRSPSPSPASLCAWARGCNSSRSWRSASSAWQPLNRQLQTVRRQLLPPMAARCSACAWLWRLPWRNEHKEVCWRLVLNRLPLASRVPSCPRLLLRQRRRPP